MKKEEKKETLSKFNEFCTNVRKQDNIPIKLQVDEEFEKLYNSEFDKFNSVISDFISESNLKVEQRKEAIINHYLKEKGYKDISNYKTKCRFPKLNVSNFEGWNYVFFDNGTIQGDFIVAIKVVQKARTPDFNIQSRNVTAAGIIDYFFEVRTDDYSPVKIKP
jgi:hypothetical protein